MSDLQSLLERLKGATGPDRELDCALAEAFGWRQIAVDHGIRIRREWARPDNFRLPIGTMADPPFFTASQDAALGLVERLLPQAEGWAWHVGENPMIVPGLGAEAWLRCYDVRRDNTRWEARAHTPALAILTALLQALIASKSPSETGE